MDTYLIILLIVVLFILFAKKSIENEKLRQERKQKHWEKIRYIQSLTASTRARIYTRNRKRCNTCSTTKKLTFYINSDEPLNWNENNVILICSECKGYSLKYDFGRKIPDHTKKMVYERDGGLCVNCLADYDV